MTHDDCRDLLALHALDALPAADERAIDSHVERCPSCASELADVRATAASLAFLAQPIAPSPDHLGRVLVAIDGAVGPRRPPTRLHVAQRHRRRTFPMRLGRLAAACMVAALLASDVALVLRLDGAQGEIEHMRAIAAFVASPDVSVVPLGGRRSHAKLAFDRTTGRFVFLATDLPPPPKGRAYRLWVIANDVQAEAAVVSASAGGTLAAPPGDGALFLFGVSIEPEDGADEPTGPMVLLSAALRNGRRASWPERATDVPADAR